MEGSQPGAGCRAEGECLCPPQARGVRGVHVFSSKPAPGPAVSRRPRSGQGCQAGRGSLLGLGCRWDKGAFATLLQQAPRRTHGGVREPGCGQGCQGAGAAVTVRWGPATVPVLISLEGAECVIAVVTSCLWKPQRRGRGCGCWCVMVSWVCGYC